MNISYGRILFTLIFSLPAFVLSAQEKRAMELADIMKFEQVKSPTISRDGLWVAHAAVPDRGDPRVLVYSSDGNTQYELKGGQDPVISSDGRWVAAIKAVPASELLVSDRGKNKGPGTGMFLLNTRNGEMHSFENVKSLSLKHI